MRSYFFLIPLLTTSAFMLAGCTTRTVVQTNTNLSQVGATNTNTAAVVNVNTSINTNTVANENLNTSVALNTNVSTNTNTSAHPDWKTYSSDFYQSDKYLQGSSFPKFTLQYPSNLIVSEDLGGPVFRPTAGDFSMSIGYGKDMTLDSCLDYFKNQNAIVVSNSIRGSWDRIDFISFEHKIADRKEKMYCLKQNNKVIIAGMALDREDYFVEILKTIQVKD